MPENVEIVRDRIHAAARRSGRKADEIELLAVTKYHPAEAVKAAYSCGIRRFGENRVQEAAGKYDLGLRSEMPDLNLDLIGTLQSNKINRAVGIFDAIQSVDSLDLLKAVEKRVGKRDKALRIYLELHTGEASKSGFPDLESLLEAVEVYMKMEQSGGNYLASTSPLFLLSGLMTMAPFTDDRGAVRSSFRALARAAEEVKKRFDPPGFGELSMGMSGDFEIAVEEGTTLLRIGTAIFGERR